MAGELEGIEPMRRCLREYMAAEETDVFIYNAPVLANHAAQFIDIILAKTERRSKATIFLTTLGGEADSAFRITRCLRRHYDRIRLLIAGPCKSAGTLIVMGAHELAFGPTGELGPLDVQITKPDDIMPVSSGLDMFQSLTIVTEYAYKSFEDAMLQMSISSNGSVSTKTAAELSAQLVTGLFSPITAQLDPLRLGEVNRAIKVARAYAERLGTDNLKRAALSDLVEGYPSHSFVIDKEEAAKYFHRVEDFTDLETALAREIEAVVRYVRQSPVIDDIGVRAEPVEDDNDDQEAGRSVANSPKNVVGDSGDLRPSEDQRAFVAAADAEDIAPSSNGAEILN